MECPSVLVCSQYADGALADAEAQSMERHLTDCAACRERVASLSAESVALRAAMLAADANGEVPAFVPRPRIPAALVGLGYAALALWAVNFMWMSLIGTAEATPGWVSWWLPDSASVGVDLLFAGAAAVVSDGGGWVMGAMVLAAELVFGAVILVVLWRALRGRTGRATAAAALLAVAWLGAAPPSVQAFELRHDEDGWITVAADETIEDTLIVAAERIEIDGMVKGDLVAAGQVVVIRGRVEGMVITAAREVTIEGEVTGSVVGFAQAVAVEGAPLGANLFLFGQSVSVDEAVQVGGNAAVFGQSVDVAGGVTRDLIAFAQNAVVSGAVAGDARAFGESVTVGPSARIDGDLHVMVPSEEKLNIAEGAVIGGETTIDYEQMDMEEEESAFGWIAGKVLGLLAAFLTGVVLFHLFPALRRSQLDDTPEVLTALGLGALALVATPLLALFAVITLVGAPIGLTVFVLWCASLYLAGIVTAGVIGRMLLGEERSQVWALLLGLVIITVVGMIPILGGLVRLAAMVIGLGLIIVWLRNRWEARPV